MQLLPQLNILGADDPESGIFKLIVPIIIAVFWVVAQILSSIGKKKQQTPPAEGDYPVSLPPEAPIPQPRPQQVPKQQRQVKHRVETRQQQRRQQQQRSGPPPLQVRAPAVSQKTVAQAMSGTESGVAGAHEASEILGTAHKSRTSTTARRLRSSLRPESLKKEFILTEILQPPVGMRNDRV